MSVEFLDGAAMDLVLNGAIEIYFQPIVTRLQHNVIGFEALLHLPSNSVFKSPDEIFHSHGAISTLTLQEVDLACMRTALKLGSELPGNGMLFINVNGPTITRFLHEYRHKKKSRLLEDTVSMQTNRVVFEINENVDPLSIRELLRLLAPVRKNNGLSIAIDDIGIRYPWLNTFTWLQPEYVKIDRYFLKNALKWKTHRRTMHGICDMMRMLDVTMVGEGIETDAEIELAKTMGIDYLQGFKFSKPMPLEYWKETIKQP